MLKLWNCFIPLSVFKLSELRAGILHIALLFVGYACILFPAPLSWIGLARSAAYCAFMCFVQRRVASGLPLRFTSLRSWRTSRGNFRQSSEFLRLIRARTPSAAGTLFSGARPVAVITGGERGMGFETAGQLSRQGIDVVLCCYFPDSAAEAVAAIRRHTAASGAEVHCVPLDLSEEESVRRCAAAVLAATRRIDILVNNAGILSDTGPRRANTRGDELVVATNFLGPVLLTELLLPAVVAGGGPARIVNLASLVALNANVPPGHTPLSILREHCSPEPAYYARNYSLSKLLNICYTRDLARRLRGTRVTVAAVHPGVVLTAIYNVWGPWAVAMRAVMRTVFKFPAEGAEVALHCALADAVCSGGFYADCALHDDCLSPLALDETQNAYITQFACAHFRTTPAVV